MKTDGRLGRDRLWTSTKRTSVREQRTERRAAPCRRRRGTARSGIRMARGRLRLPIWTAGSCDVWRRTRASVCVCVLAGGGGHDSPLILSGPGGGRTESLAADARPSDPVTCPSRYLRRAAETPTPPTQTLSRLGEVSNSALRSVSILFWSQHIPSENIALTRCLVKSQCSGFRNISGS